MEKRNKGGFCNQNFCNKKGRNKRDALALTPLVLLQVYTNGLYTPTAHRVINSDPTKSRVSIPFFYETAFDSVVQPIKQLVNQQQRHPGFEPVRYGEHLLGKVLNNFELEKQPVIA